MLGHPQLTAEKAVQTKILSNKDPVPLDLLLRLNLFQQDLIRMKTNKQTNNQTNKQTNGGCQTRSDANARLIVRKRNNQC